VHRAPGPGEDGVRPRQVLPRLLSWSLIGADVARVRTVHRNAALLQPSKRVDLAGTPPGSGGSELRSV
jgi:hypothetical protein